MLLAACSPDSATGADGKPAAGGAGATPVGHEVSGPAAANDGTSLGQLVANELINLNAIVNKTPAEVDAELGPPKNTGSDRISCVRFVPERVFFACEQEIRIYEHPKFESVRVEFEDGRAATVALAGLPGEGAFNPDAALALVGVRLPDGPRHDNPSLGMGGDSEAVVDRWEWSNTRARLLVDGLQFRVRLSVVNGEWSRAKFELINNNPLDADQQARIKPVRGTEGAAGG